MILLSVGPAPGALAAPAVARGLGDDGHRVEAIMDSRTGLFVGLAAFAGSADVVREPSEPPEAVVFAPATAGTLARLARGLDAGPAGASATGDLPPVFVAPDLDAATAAHPAVRENLDALRGRGWRVVPGGEGAWRGPRRWSRRCSGGSGGRWAGCACL